MYDPTKKAQITADYASLKQALFTGENAVELATNIILEELSK